jgi:hypothetical protein
MSEPKDPQRPMWPLPPATPEPVDDSQPPPEGPGRVVHDARGNAVWNWSGRIDNDSTTHLLRKLDSPELALADDAFPQARETPAVPGIDPYNKRNEQRTAPKPSAGQARADEKSPKDSVLRQLLGRR